MPRLRDDHDALTANFWYWEIKILNYNPDTITGWELLRLISKGKLTSEETIQRARRKAQQDNIELRGKKYEERQQEEKDVRKNISR